MNWSSTAEVSGDRFTVVGSTKAAPALRNHRWVNLSPTLPASFISWHDINVSPPAPSSHRATRLVRSLAGGRSTLIALVAAVGVLGGLVGAAYVAALKLLERLLWPTHTSHSVHLAILVGVGVAVAGLIRLLGTPGDVELLVDNIHVSGGAADLADLPALLPVSLLCIASGGGMGPEAPLVQTTGSLGSWLGRRFGVSTTDGRVLTIGGMAAGFTVLFGAPLGSAVFALEILHRQGLEYYEALVPSLVGALSGYLVSILAGGAGLHPIFTLPVVTRISAVDLLWGLACGVVGAAVAVTFTYLTRGLQWLFGHVPVLARPALGGLVLGLLALWSPWALTFGEAQINTQLATKATGAAFALAALAKLCGTTTTLASGWRGGFIIPLFFIGVTLGQAGHVLFPHSNQVVLIAALMAAANCGVTKTPLGSALVVSEMSGLVLLPPVILASLVSLFLTSEVGLIHSQRARQPERPVAGDGLR
jgi:H+/Cl- antiporter ClcA